MTQEMSNVVDIKEADKKTVSYNIPYDLTYDITMRRYRQNLVSVLRRANDKLLLYITADDFAGYRNQLAYVNSLYQQIDDLGKFLSAYTESKVPLSGKISDVLEEAGEAGKLFDEEDV